MKIDFGMMLLIWVTDTFTCGMYFFLPLYIVWFIGIPMVQINHLSNKVAMLLSISLAPIPKRTSKRINSPCCLNTMKAKLLLLLESEVNEGKRSRGKRYLFVYRLQ